ncbi:MAG: 4-hydroxythreonine-4-phosphate dehydrogenase PdxA [Verrucomicrobia bacterium]|nr:4-hydroxythreonine-4-phosphate dehydrogenase PdxA [Verrucomicrobiota bacterium]MCF7707443.1 4-hydroxythreonine-4-phosphate dehydrogenase PdxA [Verrucomicrobiota bacterium]
MNIRIAVSLGDVTGIGPEVVVKALAAITDPSVEFIIIGDAGVWDRAKAQFCPESVSQCHDEDLIWSRTRVVSPIAPLTDGLEIGDPASAVAAVGCLETGAGMCLNGEADALVTAPVNKSGIIRTGLEFHGQTEFLARLAGAKRVAMMLLGHDDRQRWLRVVLVTTHIRLCEVSERLTMDKVLTSIELASDACKSLGLSRRRVGVCGLNPHAGEQGEIGDEEVTCISPAVEKAASRGFDVIGPIPADVIFHSALKGEFDVVVAMYHDQGLAPLKMIAFETGVNWTLGLPFIRTSPDHGTAYDIAGKGMADPTSTIAAINLALNLARAHKISTANKHERADQDSRENGRD